MGLADGGRLAENYVLYLTKSLYGMAFCHLTQITRFL
jgi:hypothetical protein